MFFSLCVCRMAPGNMIDCVSALCVLYKFIFEVQLNSNKTRTAKLFFFILGHIYDFDTENPPSQVLQIFCSSSVYLSLALFYSITTCLFSEQANRPLERFRHVFPLFTYQPTMFKVLPFLMLLQCTYMYLERNSLHNLCVNAIPAQLAQCLDL